MSRPQIGIDRLPPRRLTDAPRESMNCKSCRKRKIKCNRLRPTCEACQVFACPCIYDAVPKKRGPKTDVLEALLKRVDGLEKRLHNEKKEPSPDSKSATAGQDTSDSRSNGSGPQQRQTDDIQPPPAVAQSQTALLSPTEPSHITPVIVPDVLLDIYFSRIHGKPYHILDESATRQRMQMNQLPAPLAYAIYAVSARYATHLGGYNNAFRISQEYNRRSRMELDIDEPSIEALQTLLLLAQASYQGGKGKKTYMFLSSAISMAFALDLHRELPLSLNVSPAEREGRRRLFWACYLMDRFSATGSKRPSLIADESIILRLPSWQLHPGSMVLEGDYFPNGSNLQYMTGSGKHSQGSTGMLIGIARTLGITNRYLAAGGVKGDSHFPWHSLSNLSKIRQELDIWASETQDTFTSLESLFGQPDSAVLVLSKLIYHLIHCLIYRPFLPVDLAELSGTSQHQSWQIEATNLCFLHANAIAELVEIGRASSIIDWPAFVGYCVCTAGTIHVHGAHYQGREGEVFSASAEFLSREMHQLSELRLVWAGVQHQRETLQTIYGCHSELVKSLASNPLRFSPVFQLEDFFDRYPGQIFDGAHVTFTDIVVDTMHESLSPYTVEPRNNIWNPNFLQMNNMQNFASTSPVASFPQTPLTARPSQSTSTPSDRPATKKRRSTLGQNPPPPKPDLKSPQLQERNGPNNSAILSPADHRGQAANASANGPNVPESALPSLTGFTPPSFSPTFSYANLTSQNPNIDPSLEGTLFQMPTPNAMHSSIAGPPYGQPTNGAVADHPTPGATSATGSTHTDPDKDPFLSLLEQLAENEVRGGGGSELDFFLGGGAQPANG